MKTDIVSAINSSALRLLVPLTVAEVDKVIVSEAKKIVGGDFGTVFIKDKGVIQRRYSDAQFLKNVTPRKKGTISETMTLNKSRILVVKKIDYISKTLSEHGIVSIIQMPLVYKNKSFGAISIYSLKKLSFTKNDLELLSLFSSLASMVIKKTQLYAQTKSALETRDHFIALASHELRTPLTSINGYIELLSTKMSNFADKESAWIKELADESKRMTKLVFELTEINKIKQGQLQYDLRECRVSDFLDVSVKRFSFINPKRGIKITGVKNRKDMRLVGDVNKLIQMITALISNADKFSPADEEIVIDVKENKGNVVIQVVDKGLGVDSEDIKKIFTGFYKGKNKGQGLGVGLLLTKHIVQSHKGTIVTRTSEKEGSVFEVILPMLP